MRRALFVSLCCVLLSSGGAFAATSRPAVTFATLRSFQGPPRDGNNPLASLIDVGGVLYGTTQQGGFDYYGIVFSITTKGAEGIVHTFAGGPADGAYPNGSLLDVGGVLYGTTSGGGTGRVCGQAGCGTIFKIDRSGVESVLHSFGGPPDGIYPEAGPIDVGGTLYGTTYEGGGTGCELNLACGTVFAIAPNGAERVLYRFKGGSDGAYPNASLIAVDGMLLGTTTAGGSQDNGTVFALTLSGKETVLYRFAGGSDGSSPASALLPLGGRLYGTTTSGGAARSYGTVFALSASGKHRVLYRFRGGADGANPRAALVDVHGTLYGTTPSGGANGYGTIYAMTTSGEKNIVHSFAYKEGAGPYASLLDVDGTLYGVAWYGGTGPGLNADGTVYALSLN